MLVLHGLSCAAVTEGTGGIVRDVNREIVSIDFAGPAPKAGDRAEIFFEIDGVDEVITVATGKVINVDSSGTLKVQVDNATGEVAKNQLVRFTSGKGGRSQPAETTPRETPSPRPARQQPMPQETPDPEPLASPTRTLPPSVPFPTATPPGKAAATSQPDIDPAAMELIQKGFAQHSAGNLDAALASYSSAIRLAPRSGLAYLNRANSYLYKGNFQAALADANKAMELTVPKMDDVYNVRGTAKAGRGDYSGAIADCNRALKINPKNALAYNNRANNKLRLRDYSGALADCNKSIALDANVALPFYNRGFARTNLGDQGGALADWQKAVALQPSFGTELNPKIAQLQALGIRPQQSGVSAAATAKAPRAAEWTDLTNAAQKLVGSWKGGRHVTQYLADGSFYTDPHLVPNPPRGQWRIEGDRLIQHFPQAGMTTTHNILSISGNELVLRNAKGQTFRFKRGSE